MYNEIGLKVLSRKLLVFSIFASNNLICRSFIKIIYTNGQIENTSLILIKTLAIGK